MSTDNGNVLVRIEMKPIKGEGNATPEQLEAQATAAERSMEAVDFHAARGTCGDERERAGLLNGSAAIEARPSVFGGPDIYALSIAELTGVLPESITSGEAALRWAKDRINDAGFLSGGHAKCAANAGFKDWMSVIAYNPAAVADYVKMQLGEAYDPVLMAEVTDNAKVAVESGRYDDWNEGILIRVLGDEAGEAIEVLAAEPDDPNKVKPHEAKTFIREKIRGKTVNQTALFRMSVLGGGSFVVTDLYAADLQAAITSGPEAARLTALAAHAHEAMNAAVAGAVPNETIYQIDLTVAE